MSHKLEQILSGAEEDMLEHFMDKDETGYLGDLVHEVADSSVPIMNGELLELAAESNDLALVEPEIGPAFDGSATPVNIIAANVYEAIAARLYERFQDKLDWYACHDCGDLVDPDEVEEGVDEDDEVTFVCDACIGTDVHEVAVRS